MNTRATIALGITFVVLIAAYFAFGWWESRRVREAAAAKRVFDFEARDIAAVTIERAEGIVVEAAQHADGWDIVRPYEHIDPNQIVWGRLSNAWATLTNERTLGERDLAAYGLENPVLTITATTRDGDESTIRFGGTEPLQVGRYAYADDVGVFLVREEQFRELDRPLDDLRHRHLVRVGEEGITQLAFAFLREPEDGAGMPLDADLKPAEQSVAVVAGKQDGRWHLQEPIEAAADQEAVDELARALQFAVGTGYVDAPESYEDYGLDPPRGQVTMWSEAGADPQVVFLGNTDAATGGGALWAKKRGDPAVFKLSGHILGLLPQDPDSFRERRLLTRELEGLDSVAIEYKGGAIRLEKDPDRGWQMREPVVEDTDQGAVSGYLSLLKNVRGDEFPDVTAGVAGLIAPEYQITLNYPDESRQIRIGGPVPDRPEPLVYAQQDVGAITVIAEVLRNAIVRGPFDFREKRLIVFEPRDVTAIRGSLDGRDVVIEQHLGQWRVTVPAGAVLESQSDVAALLAALRDLRAVAIEPEEPADPEAYGLADPVFTVELTLTDEEGVTREVGPLQVGAVAEDNAQQRFARTATRPEVFRVRQAFLDSVREALRGVRN
jgi:hypothetical protein